MNETSQQRGDRLLQEYRDSRAKGDWEYPIIYSEASLTPFGECRKDELCRCRVCKPPLYNSPWRAPNWLVYLTLFWIIIGLLAIAG